MRDSVSLETSIDEGGKGQETTAGQYTMSGCLVGFIVPYLSSLTDWV